MTENKEEKGRSHPRWLKNVDTCTFHYGHMGWFKMLYEVGKVHWIIVMLKRDLALQQMLPQSWKKIVV